MPDRPYEWKDINNKSKFRHKSIKMNNYKEEIEFLKEKGYILKDKTFEDLHYLPQCTWEDILKVMKEYKERCKHST